jgi:hypothetical protein
MITTKQKIKTLKNNYNKQVSSLLNNANKLIRNIMNNRRLNNNTKIIQINSIKQQFNNKVQKFNI